MRTVLSVIAPHSGSGKTLFVTHLVRQIRGLGCLKISPGYEWPEEKSPGDETSGQDFFLEADRHLNRPGKDTALYLAAGAARVERLRHRGNSLAAGLNAALERFPATMPVVVESSSAVLLLRPAAVVLVARPPIREMKPAVVLVARPPIREMKPATAAILSRVTDLLINASEGSGPPTAAAERLQREYPSLRPQHTYSADLLADPPPGQMLTRLQALLVGE
ncbi:MAG: hypothetical protein ACYS7M_15640 [Planctomycetota bacterium]|jgi:molybdopterin-guanine dinucleotide biosynthesis protein